MTEIREGSYYEYKGETVFVITISQDKESAEILTLGGPMIVDIKELS
jgi:hypothetical protein